MKKLTKTQKHRYVRICWDVKGKPVRYEFTETPPISKKVDTAFDELVLGDFFHLERLSDENYLVKIGYHWIEFNVTPKGVVNIREAYSHDPNQCLAVYGGTD